MTDKLQKYLPGGSLSPGRRTIATALVLAALVTANPSRLMGADPQEYQVKAGFINNIAKFVLWPPGTFSDPEEPFVLYILGEDRFGTAFGSFEGRMIHQRPLAVRKIEAWEDIPADCRILYVGVSGKKEIERVLGKAAGRAILTISDEPLFVELGGVMGLVTVDNRIRFAVNTLSAGDAGLMISSNLIKLAISVQGEVR